ncbi:ABC transporter ATP-binding protein [Actinotalea sp. K2]|uniref:ABC transporter ATP-binding protein n=1 Tax=Actinotalea sp. K2 TaxID=2939438 RepID=UPI00201815D1|nr:ABC transporter ATP-binding protein [Actinotalea sp. K2]MCL3862395.1 ATP-binding cassette domain-containing protein [Actinotalea sp. K2]
MIRFEHVSVTYPGAIDPTLRDVSVVVPEGEMCLVVGPTGAGKSTLLRASCGLVPHFTGGHLEGRVLVDGRDTRTHQPRDLADVVGVVAQDPSSGFVTDTVEEELAYGMEQLGLPPAVMRKRVEEVMDLLRLASLRGRPLADLSGGEQQRVAIGAVMTSHPRVLVLDEPTSALDPAAAEDVLAALTRLVHDLGMTVLLSEHRLERVVQYTDRIISLSPGGTATQGAPESVLRASVVAPPIVELGRLAGWEPLPLSVRDARRQAAPLRALLQPGPRGGLTGSVSAREAGAPVLVARDVHVRHGQVHAVRGVDLRLRAGEVTAVMGRNGAGKSSLLWALQGAGPRSRGSVLVHAPGARPTARGQEPAQLSPANTRRLIALVPQNPTDLLYLDTVAHELEASDRQSGARTGTTADLLTHLAPGITPDAHPRDLSEGQRLALVLAIQLSADPRVLLLDEPTRGLDYATKQRLAAALAEHAGAGGATLLSSHDVEFVAECADRVVVLADGEVVADGAAREILVASPTFAPQVAKILHPLGLLTLTEVRHTLGAPA